MKNPKRRWYLPALAVLVAGLVGVDMLMLSFGRTAAPVSMPDTASTGKHITLSDVLNATISDPAFGGNNIIKFENGHQVGVVYYGKGDTNLGVATETADILTDPGQSATGDLNGDGVPDLAIVITQNTGGSGSYRYLVVFTDDGGVPRYQAAASLGDRVRVNTVSISKGMVTVDMVTQGPGEPMCCGTLEKKLSYTLKYNSLELAQNSTPPNMFYEGWLGYTDPDLDFSIRYPADFTVSTTTDGGTGAPVVVFKPKTEAYFPESDAAQIADSRGLTVTVDDNAESCGALPADDPRISVGALDTEAGEFTTISSGDAGMSQYYYSTDYYITHKGLCYKLNYTTHQVNPGVYDWTPIQVTDARYHAGRDLNVLKAVIDQMIQSFSFTM